MTFDQRASSDFERAASRGFWRRIVTRLTGENNELLPFDEVREKLVFRGQRYIGIKQVSITSIIGSMGRYNDFDRAFLPTQTRTKGRWISIGEAHYADIYLPPVDLYKVGEIYFVKDGNHRVSVARERGQEFIDAYVTEIDLPVLLTSATTVQDLDLKGEQAEFILETRLDKLIPEADISVMSLGEYPRLLEHIHTHQWYLGIQQDRAVGIEEAVRSWYDNVYFPVIQTIREHDLLLRFPKTEEAELYLWIMEYIAYLRQVHVTAQDSESNATEEAARQLMDDFQLPGVRALIQVANRSTWIREWILAHERLSFLTFTGLTETRPDADIETTLMGQYETLKDHIAAHRWYLGEQNKSEVPAVEAVLSWYDHVYLPIVEIIRDQHILEMFPERTETDLYLWIIRHQWFLRENYGSDVAIEEAAGAFMTRYSQRKGISFLNLPGADRSVVLQALFLLPSLALSLKLFGFQRVHLWVLTRALKIPAQDLSGAAARNHSQHVADLVGKAAWSGIFSVSCLPRSLGLYLLLRRQGVISSLCLGFRREDSAFQAHAWIEVDHFPLLEREDIRKDYMIVDASQIKTGFHWE